MADHAAGNASRQSVEDVPLQAGPLSADKQIIKQVKISVAPAFEYQCEVGELATQRQSRPFPTRPLCCAVGDRREGRAGYGRKSLNPTGELACGRAVYGMRLVVGGDHTSLHPCWRMAFLDLLSGSLVIPHHKFALLVDDGVVF